MNTKKNLVLCLIKSYSWYVCEHFVRSFAKHFTDTDLVVFVDDLSNFTLHQLEQVGKEIKGGEIKLVPFPDELKSGNPANSRWKAFADYVDMHVSDYDQIFLSDSRDVFFQGNVFDSYKSQSKYLACALEDFAGTLGFYRGSAFDWLYGEAVKVFGKDEADKLADKLFYCPSTIAGTSAEIKIFLNTLLKYMPNDFDFYTLDLIVETYIMYNKLVPVENIIDVLCFDGSMTSADWYFKLTPIEIKNNFVLRGDGGIPAAVHQYDRHEILVDLADRLYRKQYYQPIETFTDVKSNLDQLLNLLRNENLETTLRFFTTHLANQTNLHNFGGKLLEAWEILLSRKTLDSSCEILNTAIQVVIMSALEKGLYIKQGRKIVQLLKHCKNVNLTVVEGFEDLFKQKVLKAVQWHFEHDNVPRYPGCIQLMTEANLTDNEYFYFLNADVFRSNGEREEAARYYARALKLQGKDMFEVQRLTSVYWQKLVEEIKFFTVPLPKVIQPTQSAEEKNVYFDKLRNSFVKVDSKN